MSGGEFATFEESEQACLTWQLQHPVLWDAGNRNHRNFGIKSWPSVYLIDLDGKVFWHGNPNRLFARPEELQHFRSMLEEHLKTVVVGRDGKIASIRSSVDPVTDTEEVCRIVASMAR